MDKSKILLLIGASVVIGAVVYLLVWYKLAPKNPVEQLESVSEGIPEITTNPIENKVPEVNPVEVVNPFHYENPLR